MVQEYSNFWTYQNQAILTPNDNFGFVYAITHKDTNKQYIGKKQFYFSSRVAQKGKTRKKVVKKESDWKHYYGSSKRLLADVELYGKDAFTREILYMCANKSQCSYLELREQMDRRVLESDAYYNDWISAKVVKTAQISVDKLP